MAASDLVAGTVMAKAASLLNDTAREIYTYTVSIPYLQIALQELREFFELHGISVTHKTSSVINIPAGYTTISYNAVAPFPALPTDLVEPIQLWERAEGIDPYIPMVKKSFLLHNVEGVLTSNFVFFTWNNQQIEFLPANRDNDIKIDYLAELFSPIENEGSLINVVNAATFLEFRTAALMAEFIERNLPSANSLNAQGVLALERATGIGVKNKQSITTRRRPFRAAYKHRSGI